MFPDLGMTPDPVNLVYRAVLQLLPESEADVVHELQPPAGIIVMSMGLPLLSWVMLPKRMTRHIPETW